MTGRGLLVAALAWLALTARAESWRPPEFAAVRDGWRSSYARLLDRHEQPLLYRRVDPAVNRLEWTPLDRVSPALVDALLFVEDRDFHRHHGVDWGAFSRAAWRYATGRRTRGASTLTMQTVALLDPALGWQPGGRGLARKWRQLGAARALEKQWQKPQILEAYLNLTHWRGDLQGLDAASRALFGKLPAGLDRDESLLLVSLLSSPAMPPAQAAGRACRLAAAGFSADCGRMRSLALSRLGSRRPDLPEPAALLPLSSRLSSPDMDLATTLDGALQAFAAQSLREQLASLSAQGANGGAVLVLDNVRGEVLAYVANSGLDPDSAWVDSVTARRQAGSTLKPFLFGLALEQRRLTAASILEDSPVNIPTERGLYVPQNYDRDFKGPVTVRTALASSLNVPAVRALGVTGLDEFWRLLRRQGFTLAEEADFYGNALALGGADISLWELANAYRALANGGQWSPARWQRDAPGTSNAEAGDGLSPATAFIVGDILSDRNARSLTFGYENPLATPFWTAVKTGTSKDMRDNWCVGWSRRYTVAVWVGNMQGLPMRNVSGTSGAAPVWQALMARLEGGQGQSQPPGAPAGVVRQAVDFAGLPLPRREEWFLDGSETPSVVYDPESLPRIEYPAEGTLIALDPDIPPARQRLVIRSRTGGEALSLWLNGRRLGAAGLPLSWSPRRGRHRLELRTAQGEVRSRTDFEVRGLLVPVGRE